MGGGTEAAAASTREGGAAWSGRYYGSSGGDLGLGGSYCMLARHLAFRIGYVLPMASGWCMGY